MAWGVGGGGEKCSGSLQFRCRFMMNNVNVGSFIEAAFDISLAHCAISSIEI